MAGGADRWRSSLSGAPVVLVGDAPVSRSKVPAKQKRGRGDTAGVEISVEGLLSRIVQGGGAVPVIDPDEATRAQWRRAVYQAKCLGRFPDGHQLRLHGRSRGDVVVELVAGEHPDPPRLRRERNQRRLCDALTDQLQWWPPSRLIPISIVCRREVG
jgi:hypothetical protein